MWEHNYDFWPNCESYKYKLELLCSDVFVCLNVLFDFVCDDDSCEGVLLSVPYPILEIS